MVKRKAKLQKHFAYKYKDKDHYKHVVTISESLIDELGWKTGVELEQSINGDSLVMEPINLEKMGFKEKSKDSTANKSESNSHKMTKGRHVKEVHKGAKRKV